MEKELLERELIVYIKNQPNYLNPLRYTWKDVQQSLKADEVAIEFIRHFNFVDFDTKECSPLFLALLVSKSSKEPIAIPCYIPRSTSDVDDSNTNLPDSIMSKINYEAFWGQIEPFLEGISTVFFSPTHDLNVLPMEQFGWEKRASDKWNMVRLSSTRELVERKDAANPQSAVLYGGLKYDLEKDELIAESRKTGVNQLMASRAVENEALRYGVSYLKGTEEEVGNIERDLKENGIECVTISGNAGTEESFRALSGKSVDILHLATHGYFWSEEDAERRSYIPFLNGTGNTGMRAEDKAMLRSGLFFSGANVSLRGEELPDDVEDGVLTAMELSNLNLGKVDLVVLSACQSGLGETSGDGVFGLQRGFKLAGAKTLLMSLWKVDDKATQILMTEFYKNLLAGDTKVESLKKAQKVLQADETYKDPEYWAGWILLDALN